MTVEDAALRTYPLREFEELQARLAETEAKLEEAQELIRAIQQGEVDAVVVSGPAGAQVFTLKGAEYAYRALVEAMSEGAATLGADGTVLYCNQHFANLLGIPIEQIIGHGAAKLFADQAGRFESLFALCLNTDGARAEIDLRSAEGRNIPVQVSLRAMKTDEPTAVCMVVTDLSETRRWEGLLAAGRLASSILDSAAEAIAVCDESGKIIRANGALVALCGFNPLFHLFESAMDLEITGVSGAPPEAFSINAAMRGSIPQGQEMTLRRDDGRDFILLFSSGRIAGPSGVVGFVFTLTDITLRKRATAALIQSEKLASVGRLASTIAHEINNPLEAIGNALFLATTDSELTPRVKGYLEIATGEFERVAHLTKQTLAFHRENKTPAPIDLGEILDEVLNLYNDRFETRGITIERRYKTSDPVLGVNGEIRQLISHLLSNSLDALANDGRLVCRVSRSVGGAGLPAIRMTIADTGTGVQPEQMERIFEPFFTTKEFVGTGLGLWISKQIVDKHSATIRVRSKPAIGTAISIAFPIMAPNLEVTG